MPSPARPAARRSVRAVVRRLVAVAAVGATAVALTPGTAAADHGSLPDGRHVRDYTVRPGDTATELAVRFHAWTAELISHNHLGSSGTLVPGQHLEIPVVTAAASKGDGQKQARSKTGKQDTKTAHQRPRKRHKSRATTPRLPASDPSRAAVRAEIVRAARYYGVDPELALAVSWQEAGWQMHHVSSANAVGAMQVLPSTAEWMSMYAGRQLDVRNTRDNIAAGVLLLDVLRGMTGSREHQIGAYYQGPGAVQSYGLYAETRAYVANVQAIKRNLERGNSPI